MARRFHLPALGGLATTIGGLLVAVTKSPELLATVPGKVAAVVIAAGSIVQAFTKPVPKGQ